MKIGRNRFYAHKTQIGRNMFYIRKTQFGNRYQVSVFHWNNGKGQYGCYVEDMCRGQYVKFHYNFNYKCTAYFWAIAWLLKYLITRK